MADCPAVLAKHAAGAIIVVDEIYDISNSIEVRIQEYRPHIPRNEGTIPVIVNGGTKGLPLGQDGESVSIAVPECVCKKHATSLTGSVTPSGPCSDSQKAAEEANNRNTRTGTRKMQKGIPTAS